MMILQNNFQSLNRLHNNLWIKNNVNNKLKLIEINQTIFKNR